MDWKLFGSTFVAIFLAELGDKTQLAAFALSAGSKSRLTVFVAAASALVLTSAIAVIAGAAVGRFIPARALTRTAGIAFLMLGVWMLAKPGD